MALSLVVSGIFNVENIVILKFGSEVTQGIDSRTIRKIWHGFLLVFYSNFVLKILFGKSYLWTPLRNKITCRDIA